MYSLIKSLLFSLPPEKAHDYILLVARLSPAMGKLTGPAPLPLLRLPVGNISWASPVGLAAGLDKNAEALDFFAQQGFGALECGTITLHPQLGNARPRLWRYPEEKSLRNAMGFPNQGLLAVLPRLRAYQGAVPLGINIGMNKDSTPADSIEQLALLLETMEDLADYFVINVSSPNTPGLRAMQEKSYLTELFQELNLRRGRKAKDLYLKIAPDLPDEKIRELTQLASDLGLTGMIATNTTIMPERGAGGVSGLLLQEKSRRVRQIILQEKTGLEVIAVGGISSPGQLFELWAAGGKAVQIYTAYVYQGPALIKLMHQQVIKLLSAGALPSLAAFFELPLSQRQKLIQEFSGNR